MESILDAAQYQLILESLPLGVYVVDRERRIIFWNDGAERITGYLRHEVIGRSCFDDLLMHCDEENNILCGRACPLAGTMGDGKPREAMIYLQHNDGQRVPVRVRAAALRDAVGHIIGATEIFDEGYPQADLRVHPHAEAAQHELNDSRTICNEDSVRAYLAACLEDFNDDRIPFGVLRIAVDDFGTFHAMHGARAGAKALEVVGATLIRNLRSSDMIGRGSNEVFTVVLSNCTSPALDRVIAKLRHVVAASAVRWWGDDIHVTVSAGGAIVRPNDTPESLLSRSEDALQAALGEPSNPVSERT